MDREHIVPPEAIEHVERTQAPPEPPPIVRRLQLPRVQRVGLVVLSLAPVLALAGVFEGEREVDDQRAGALAIRATLPERVRQNRTATIEVELENEGDVPLGAEVAISPEYLDGCVAIRMTPAPHRAWAARFAPIAPGERASMSLQFEAEGAGPHEGVLRVSSDDGEARMRLSTFVFP